MTRPQLSAGMSDLLDRAGTFILANVFWVLLSIPLITLPTATAALFATLAPWARGKESEVFGSFFPAARQHWRKATLIGLLDLVICGWIVLNLSIFRLMAMPVPLALLSQSVTLFVALIGLMVNLYIWPLLVMFDLPLRELLLTALKFVFVHPVWSLALLVMALVPVIVSLLLPAAILVLATASAIALVVNWGAWRVIQRYVITDEHSTVEG